MLRKTLTIVSLIGLLLSVGLCGVSYFHVVAYSRQSGCALTAGILFWSSDPSSLLYVALSSHGAKWWSRNSSSLKVHWGDGREETYPLSDGTDWVIGGFSDFETRWTPAYRADTRRIQFILPLWIPPLLFLALVLFLNAIPSLRRRKRKKLGLCLKCGYDLRASKDRCPECGQEFEKQ